MMNMIASKLTIVPAPRGIDVHELQHHEIKAIDWTRIHLEGDRNPPISLGRCLGRWSMPVSRKGK